MVLSCLHAATHWGSIHTSVKPGTTAQRVCQPRWQMLTDQCTNSLVPKWYTSIIGRGEGHCASLVLVFDIQSSNHWDPRLFYFGNILTYSPWSTCQSNTEVKEGLFYSACWRCHCHVDISIKLNPLTNTDCSICYCCFKTPFQSHRVKTAASHPRLFKRYWHTTHYLAPMAAMPVFFLLHLQPSVKLNMCPLQSIIQVIQEQTK